MGKGGGGGSTNAKVNVPDQLNKNNISLSQLGAYGAGYVPGLTSLANWASSIATGGNVGGLNPFNTVGGGDSSIANKTLGYTTNLGATLAQQTPGQLGGTGGTGVTGTGAAGGESMDAWFQSLGPLLQNVWGGIQAQENQGVSLAQRADQLYGEGQALIPTANQTLAQGQQMIGTGQGIVGQGQNTFTQGQGMLGQGQGTFGQGEQMLGAAQGTFGQGTNLLGTGTSMLGQATSGTGLYPSQQAYVDQAVKAQQAAIQQQLASEGLTSSTQKAQLQGQAAQQGAATAGQLIQQNIAAAQAEQDVGISEQGVGLQQGQQAQAQEQIGLQQMQVAQAQEGVGLSQIGLGLQQEGVGQTQIGLGDQQLSLAQNWSQLGVATQQAAISAISTMAAQSQAMQAGMWNQALSGYGLVGNFLQTSMAGFGESTQGWMADLKASEDNAQITAQAQLGAQQASAQGFGSLLGGVGQLLGGNSGGGGLPGGLGSVFGGGGAAAGGAIDALGTLGDEGLIGSILGGTGAAVGGSGALGGIVAGIGAAFCMVAREVYGTYDGTWVRFREWMLFDAPVFVRMFYVKHAPRVARWLKRHPEWKDFFKFYMDLIIENDQ